MNRYFLLLGFVLFFSLQSCDKTDTESGKKPGEEEGFKPLYFGEKFSDDKAINSSELKDKMGNAAEYQGAVKGDIIEVCQKEGCWLSMDLGDGTSMQVDFHHHSFTIPKDLAGRIAIAKGRAYYDTTSVEDLRHYAEDAGKTKAQIDSITEPRAELLFDATGLIIR